VADADYIIVGSGINSLVAAAMLGRAGHSVLVLERAPSIGGNLQTEALLREDYLHDTFSGFHPLFVTSPAYDELGDSLTEAGLQYANTPVPTASILPDGTAASLLRGRADNVEALESRHPGDGQRWNEAMATFEERSELGFALLSQELWGLSGASLAAKQLLGEGPNGLLARVGDMLTPSRAFLERVFEAPEHRAIHAPWVLHNGLGPEDLGGGFINQLIGFTLEKAGMPIPVGGAGQLVAAFLHIFRELGVEVRQSTDVERIVTRRGRAHGVRTAAGEELSSRHGVIANVTPTQLYLRLLDAEVVPDDVRDEARAFRYGLADMQIHFALSGPPRWRAEGLEKAGIVHVTDGVDGVSRARNEATRGLLPARPTIVCGQHTALDPSRAPEGGATLWIQLQELPRHPVGDAGNEIGGSDGWSRERTLRYADRVTRQLGTAIENLDEVVLDRAVLSPADLEARNINLVGGDPYSGACQFDQFFFWRPLKSVRRHTTPIDGLHHIGASTHPGPGLHGSSGYMVAKTLT